MVLPGFIGFGRSDRLGLLLPPRVDTGHDLLSKTGSMSGAMLAKLRLKQSSKPSGLDGGSESFVMPPACPAARLQCVGVLNGELRHCLDPEEFQIGQCGRANVAELSRAQEDVSLIHAAW